MISLDERLAGLLARLPDLDLHGRLLQAVDDADAAPVFTTSLGLEDQVITAAIAAGGLPIRIVTLHTGRLFPETVDLIERTEAHFGIGIVNSTYDLADEADYVETYGMNGFYESRAARHACCWFRKMKPLARALKGADTWITGLRRGQSDARLATPFAELDSGRGLIKINPLADWDLGRIERFVAEHAIPVNPLHARGYPSIGCEPCTRAVKPGEPERAGRWWWENDDTRECGLHVGPRDGVVSHVRTGGEAHV